MYLSVEERTQVAANVRDILAMFSEGVWITPDFATRTVADDAPEKIKRFRRAIGGTTDRQMYESAFESEDAIADFISEHGFTAEHHYQIDLVPHLTSMKALELGPHVLERTAAAFKNLVHGGARKIRCHSQSMNLSILCHPISHLIA